MERKVLLFVCFCLLLSACAPANGGMPTLTAIPSLTASPELTKTPTLALSATLLPSKTSAPPTITPLPTIATITPTFDVRTIVTATPASKAECPKENPELVSPSAICNEKGCSGPPSDKDISNYLNLGGMLNQLSKANLGILLHLADLTGDGLEDVVFIDYSLNKLFVHVCKNGKYEILLEFKGTQQMPYLDHLSDLNKNGIPELIVSNHERGAFTSISIFEWDGHKFGSLVEVKSANDVSHPWEYDWVGGTIFHYKVTDINKDDLQKIIAVDEPLHGDPAFFANALPLRNETLTIGWNGEHVVIEKQEYAPPLYRFQAVQDADRLVLNQDYDGAMQLYKQAIFNDKLSWWSKDRKAYEVQNTIDNYSQQIVKYETPIPTIPAISPDTTEYPRLAAYAYYRMVILHTYIDDMNAAKIKYATLQEKFPAGNPGHPYVEMATDFWNAYQSSGKMYDACAAAIAYADAHPEILTPLGSDYHGAQSHTYVPADVCPFR